MPYSSRAGRKPRYSHSKNSHRQKRKNNNFGKYIDPSRFVKAANPVAADSYTPENSFADFDIRPILKTNLAAKGYVIPSPIQDQTIPIALTGRDIIGIANTGTGKTAAFAIPVLNKILSDNSTAAIIVAPTRELAEQIQKELRDLAKDSRICTALLIGGSGMGRQLAELNRKPRVVVGTPGRIKDHLRRGSLKLTNFNLAVLDEVDRMLDMGFVNDVTEILDTASSERQSFFFSATMDDRVSKLIEGFTNNPATVSLKSSSTSENVHQDVVRYHDKADKIDKLHDLLLEKEVAKVIVFDETKYGVERLSKELVARGFNADSIHGGRSQGQRKRALDKFKNSQVNILVATDVAARGIDVADITHVINFSVPKVYDDYIHRIGRAGRAGRTGYALTFIEH